MFKTRLTEMLGIDYPIVAGGMRNISRAELVAAVSNAGALGILDSSRFHKAEELRDEIRKTQGLTDKPFGINITLFPWGDAKLNDQFIEVLVEEGVKAVETSGFRGPGEFIERLHKGNVKLIHKVASVRHAVSAEREGADAVTVVGFEQGGALGREDNTTFILVPRTVDEVKVPVLAGGGIGDARGLVAALALGAEGVIMGTRILATKECIAHPAFKEWMVKAKETDLFVIGRSVGRKARVLRNKATEQIIDLEAKGASATELQPLFEQAAASVIESGDMEQGRGGCGQVVGLIDSVVSVKELIDSMVREALAIRQRLDRIVVPS
jgi:nitronate monooxygenase